MTPNLTLVDEIRIKAHSRGSEPISGALICLYLLASEKNDYPVGPKLTDSLGECVFTRDEFARSIEANQSCSPMDYTSGIEDIHGVRVFNLDPDGIKRLVAGADTWGGSMPDAALSQEIISSIRSGDASRYRSSRTQIDRTNFRQRMQIDLPLRSIADPV